MPRSNIGEIRKAHATRQRAAAAERLVTGLKVCASGPDCPEDNPQPLGRFCVARSALDGRFNFCRTCQAQRNLRNKFGISIAEKLALMEQQGNRCAVCESEFKGLQTAHVDHDHSTGKIRGILCGHCNRALGLLRDSPSRIRALLEYALKHQQLTLKR